MVVSWISEDHTMHNSGVQSRSWERWLEKMFVHIYAIPCVLFCSIIQFLCWSKISSVIKFMNGSLPIIIIIISVIINIKISISISPRYRQRRGIRHLRFKIKKFHRKWRTCRTMIYKSFHSSPDGTLHCPAGFVGADCDIGKCYTVFGGFQGNHTWLYSTWEAIRVQEL